MWPENKNVTDYNMNKYYNIDNYYYKTTEDYCIVITDNENEFGWEFDKLPTDGYFRGTKEITEEEFQEANQRVLNRIEELEI